MSRVLLFVSAMALLFLGACGLLTPTPAPTGTPTASAERPDTATPAPGTPLTQEQAIQIALETLAIPRAGATPVENPRNPVASLMRLREYEGRGMTLERFVGVPGQDPEMLVWLVQFEGELSLALAAPYPPLLCSYAAVVVDAEKGTVIGRSYLVQAFLPPASPITREQALRISLYWTGSLPEVTAVENPRNPVARLMKLREYDPSYSSGGSLMPDPDTLVWVVQWEGVSYSAGIAAVPRTQSNYAVVVIDAQNGRIIAASRPFAPLFSAEP